ncbi:MAG: hypothetical protein K0R67_3891 [Paenibacillus sp.]|jgi:RNA polymerase sigma-70 factor (ECF subfamily)|nr:hypothetical protein [Paenibacillus sp.]
MEISDDWLVERLAERDPAGLEQLMSQYGRDVLKLVTRIVQGICSNEDIEECVSDTFVACWHKIGEYDAHKGSLRTWLLILAKYKALDYRRKRTNIPEQEQHVKQQLQVLHRSTSEKETEQIVLKKEEQEELLQMIESLEPLDRAVFYKRYFYYESLEAIADQLGLTYKAVESRLGRTRKQLRQRMITHREEGMS